MQPLREDFVEELGTSHGTEAEYVLSCGPFRVESWVHNSEIVLAKNENYWDAEAVKLEKAIFKIIQEETALMGEFMNGTIDFVDVGTAEWIEVLEAEEKFERITKLQPRTAYFFFNQGEEPFKSAKVRQAFSIALDREELNKELLQDLTVAAYGWVAPPIEIDGQNFREAVGEPVQDLMDANPDPRALLIEGLKEQGLSEDPADITVQLMYPDRESKEFVEYLQQRFQEVLGVNIELDPDEWPVFQERNRQLEYVFGFKSRGGYYNDPLTFMDLWITGNKTVPINWSNTEYDTLVKEASTSIDPEERLEKYREAERILLIEDCAIAPYAYSTSNYFIQPEVKGLMIPDFGEIVLKHVYIEE